jgi:outer membrane biosynthesis protein TonB
MSGFFGFKLSEVAVVAILLVAVLPVAKAAKANNFLPIIAGLLTYAALSTVRSLSLGFRILITVLVAVIFVPTPFRGRRVWEGFEDAAEATTQEPAKEEPAKEEPAEEKKEGEGFENAAQEKSEEASEEEKPEMLKEMMKNMKEDDGPAPSDIDALSSKFLGTGSKKYHLPSEKADGDHHMDVGSTFMKAYKQLKPEQVQALTTDTQKLISVQKDLMANLNNLKPLVSDGKEIMKTFKSFFGSEPSSA